MQTRNWEDDAGTKHYRTEIVANDMIILTPKGAPVEGGYDAAPASAAPAPAAAAVNNSADDISPEDLPF